MNTKDQKIAQIDAEMESLKPLASQALKAACAASNAAAGLPYGPHKKELNELADKFMEESKSYRKQLSDLENARLSVLVEIEVVEVDAPSIGPGFAEDTITVNGRPFDTYEQAYEAAVEIAKSTKQDTKVLLTSSLGKRFDTFTMVYHETLSFRRPSKP
jgi:hypothetical protein